MRKLITFALIAGLVITTMGPDAGARQRRRIRRAKGTYATPAIGLLGGGVAGCASNDGIGCVTFGTGGTESWVKIVIKDDAGTPVAGSITQDYNGDNQSDWSHDFCGKTPKYVNIRPGYEINVFIFTGPCVAPPGPGLATSGTVKATFSNLPS